MIEKSASDLHITAGTPPQLRIDGRLAPIPDKPLTPIETKRLCYSVLTDEQRHKFEEENELDLSFGIKSLARFRANIFKQRGAVSGAFRVIPYRTATFEELGLPETLDEIAKKPSGLVLVTGPTGCGKSTTLAALIDRINSSRQSHIITIEDPIEYLHTHKKSIVSQREIHSDTKSFANALKYILRQDPDIVLIGEMRDHETIESALRVAETGHMTFGTLHTNSCVQTINRIIDVFPAHQQDHIRMQLSHVLEAVLCQQLIPRSDGNGRVLAMEMMIPNAAIRNLIREKKLHQIQSLMQVGRGKSGMQTMNHALFNLYAKGQVSRDEILAKTMDPDELNKMLQEIHSDHRPGRHEK
jgi:twitching motility protein PilT